MFKSASRFGAVTRVALVTLGCLVGSHVVYGQTSLNWTLARDGHPNLNGVASNGSVYVMVADYGEIYTSTDAVNWTRHVVDTGHRNIRGITYDGTRFIAVGDCCNWGFNAALVYISADGTSWDLHDTAPAGTDVRLRAVAAAPGTNVNVVAVGENGKILWSADGQTWNAGDSGTTERLNGVAFGAGVFVAVGQNRTLLTSSDGENWQSKTIVTNSPGARIQSVIYTGIRFIAVGTDLDNSGYSSPLVLTSGDGLSWVRRTVSGGGGLSTVITGNGGNGLVMALSGGVRTSWDGGINWTDPQQLPPGGTGASKEVSAGAYGPAGFVACGGQGALYTGSSDGSSWTPHTRDASRYMRALAEGDGRLCAVGGDAAWSADGGMTWTNAQASGGNIWAYAVAFGNGVFVAAGEGNLYPSDDCSAWTEGGSGIWDALGDNNTVSFHDVAFGAGQFVGVGLSCSDTGPSCDNIQPLVFTSTDGRNWTPWGNPALTGPFDIGSVAYGNSRWVATGGTIPSGGTGRELALMTSENGTDWTRQPWPFGNQGVSVRFVHDRFFAGSWTSQDGLNWNPISWPGGTMAPGAIAYGAGRYVGNGWGGTMHVSTDLAHWTANPTGTFHTLYGAVFLESLNRFVVVGDSAIVYSSFVPTVSVSDASVTEGNAGETDMTFTVTLFDGKGQPVTVDYATANGTATAGTDYIAASGTLGFGGTGVSSQSVVVKVVGDTVPEPDETFRLNLVNATGAAIGMGSGTGTILTDDATLSISDGTPTSVNEGNSGMTPVTFTVTLANTSASDPVTVQYASASNSFAVAGLDFEAVSGTLTLTPQNNSQIITVNVYGDGLGENDESFVVNLSNPVNAFITRGTGSATILNDDPPPTVAINDVQVSEGNEGTRTAYFSVFLSSYFNQPITIHYATSDGTATGSGQNPDYIASEGDIRIDPGLRSSVPIPISVIGDTAVEGNENFVVKISNARYDGGSIIITKEVGTGTILDDEGVVLPSTAATWTLAQEGMDQLFGIASDGAQYVVVGAFGEIWTSPDGVGWTQRENPERNPASGAARNLRAVTYGGGRWVAVGPWDNLTSDPSRRHPIVLTSQDAVTWTPQDISAVTQNINRNLFGVAYGAGLYVAVGTGGCGPSNARTTCILSSPDGATWAYRPSPINSSLVGIAFGTPAGRSLFVAVGPNRVLLTSPDAANWSQAFVPWGMPANLNAVAWNGSHFVVVGGDTAGFAPAIMTSPDGFTWTKQVVPSEILYAFNGVSSGGGLTVAVSSANPADTTGSSIVTSSDGVTWTRRNLRSIPPGVSPSLRRVGYGPTGFVAGGNRGNLYTSPNGTSAWTSRTLAASRTHNGVAFGNGVFCAAGINGTIRRSADGNTWGQASSPPDPLAYSAWSPVVYAGGQFWTAGRNAAIATSADCDTWTVRYPATPVLPADPTTSSLNDLAYGQISGNGVLVAVGERYPAPGSTAAVTPLILASADGGTTWTERAAVIPSGVQRSFVTAAYGNGRFVAFGTDWATGELFLNTSNDGLTWIARQADVFDNGSYEGVNDLAFGNGLFVAVADRIWTSPDGIAWTLRKNWGPGSEYFLGVTFGSERFVAVGYSGTAYVSAHGMTWTPGSAPTDHNLLAVAASTGSTRVVAVGVSAVAYTDLTPPVSPPAISVGDASVAEGNKADTLSLTVSLSRATSQTVSVQYATANGTATAGSDYQAASGTLTFQPGETQRAVSVRVLGDSLYERDETVLLNLSNATNATIGAGSGVGTILNDDPKPALAIKDPSVLEGNSGTTPVTFTVTLSPASGVPATVSWATRDGTATVAGQDYVAGSGVLVFSPGDTSKSIAVRVKGDRTPESNETFFVDLTAPVDAVISVGTAAGTIKNDDK